MYTLMCDGEAFKFDVDGGEVTIHYHDGSASTLASLVDEETEYRSSVSLGDDCYTKGGTLRKALEPVQALVDELCKKRDEEWVDVFVSEGVACPHCRRVSQADPLDDEWQFCPWCGTAYKRS